jgi:hypothetical protein
VQSAVALPAAARVRQVGPVAVAEAAAGRHAGRYAFTS